MQSGPCESKLVMVKCLFIIVFAEFIGWSGASEASEAINLYILVRFCTFLE
jgi:hypothetical protein